MKISCLDFIGPMKHKLIVAQKVIQQMNLKTKDHEKKCKCLKCFTIEFLKTTVMMNK